MAGKKKETKPEDKKGKDPKKGKEEKLPPWLKKKK